MINDQRRIEGVLEKKNRYCVRLVNPVRRIPKGTFTSFTTVNPDFMKPKYKVVLRAQGI